MSGLLQTTPSGLRTKEEPPACKSDVLFDVPGRSWSCKNVVADTKLHDIPPAHHCFDGSTVTHDSCHR